MDNQSDLEVLLDVKGNKFSVKLSSFGKFKVNFALNCLLLHDTERKCAISCIS